MSIKKILLNLDLYLGCCILIVLVIVAVATVISRYIISSPFMWSEEAQVLCFTWISFLGAGVAFRHGAHVSIEMLVDLIPFKIRRYIELVIALFVSVLLCYVGYLSIVYVNQSILLEKTTTILKIPDYLYCLSVPVGCLFMIVSNTVIAVTKFLTQTEAAAE